MPRHSAAGQELQGGNNGLVCLAVHAALSANMADLLVVVVQGQGMDTWKAVEEARVVGHALVQETRGLLLDLVWLQAA